MTVPTSVYASDHEFQDGIPVDPVVVQRIDLAGEQLAETLLHRFRKQADLGGLGIRGFGVGGARRSGIRVLTTERLTTAPSGLAQGTSAG